MLFSYQPGFSQATVFVCRTSGHEPRVVGQNVTYEEGHVISQASQALDLQIDYGILFQQYPIPSHDVQCR